MPHIVRGELVDAIRPHYRSATGKQKRRILDEFVARSGYHPKSAIRALNTTGHELSSDVPNTFICLDTAATDASLCGIS
jgi:hypothetical protein